MVSENIHLFILSYVFFIYPAIKRIIVSFPFNIWFITFCLDYFFNSKLFLICFLQFFFVQSSTNSFSVKVINNIFPRKGLLNFFNHKIFFWPIFSVNVCRNIFIFLYSNNVTLPEKCPNTEIFLVRIFQNSDWFNLIY